MKSSVAVSIFVEECRLRLDFLRQSLKGFENADLRPAWHSHGCLARAASLVRTCLRALD